VATRVIPTPGVSHDGWVSLGVVARPHGIQGALKLHLWQGESEALHAGLELQLADAAEPSGWRIHRVKSYAAGVLHLEDVRDRTAAEAVQGKEVRVRRADFPQDEVSTYLVDLVGAVVEDASGRALGTVHGFSDNGAQALLEVRTAAGAEVLVPFVEPIVVSIEEGEGGQPGRVVLAPPGGLFDEDAVVDEP
jgi:16S rRNA processing protein RimM